MKIHLKYNMLKAVCPLIYLTLSPYISLHLLTSRCICFCRDLLSHGLFQAGAEPAANATRQVSCILPVDVHSACRTNINLHILEYYKLLYKSI